MPEFIVVCRSDFIGFKSLLASRLIEAGTGTERIFELTCADGLAVSCGVGSLARALARLMLFDLRAFELERFAACLPYELAGERAVISRAMALTRPDKWLCHTEGLLNEFLSENSVIAVDGFMRFRLQCVEEEWAEAVERAGEELLLLRQRYGLLRLLAEVCEAELATGGAKIVRLILHEDGTVVVTEKDCCRIESSCAGEAGIMGLLIGLAPSCVEVFDLSGGAENGLICSIRAVFGGKARIFVKKDG